MSSSKAKGLKNPEVSKFLRAYLITSSRFIKYSASGGTDKKKLGGGENACYVMGFV